jgi:trigger factor
MAEPVTTTVTELPESRVRVEAEVPAAEVEKRVAVAARALGRNLRIPGFRTGKVPPPVIIQRVGREAVLDEAVRESIAGWYTAAIDAAKVVPVGEPNLDLDDLPGEGEPLRFSIEIGVRPEARLGKYQGLEVGKRDAEVPDEAIDKEIEQLRDRMAKLETVERAAATGDYVVMDFLGTLGGEPFGGGEGRDQMVELGSGRLVPGFEEQLEGASAGDERTVKIKFPEASDSGGERAARDRGAEDLAGKEAEFAVTVKEVKAKELPELDEDFAAEAGFDTLDELRDDIRERLSEAQEREIEAEFREAALDAVVDAATIDVPDALVEARARELWDQMAHTLSHQGITSEMYLQIAGGKTEDEVIEENKEPAARDLRREAVLAAVVEAEGIEATDEDVLESLERAAAAEGGSPKKLLERLKSSGRLESLKADLAQRKAIDHIAESARPKKVEQSTAERAAASGLWTPGS